MLKINLTISNLLFVCLIFLIFFISLIYPLGNILIPFVFAAILAYLSNPLVLRLNKMGLSRFLSVAIVFSGVMITIALLIILFIPFIQKQIVAIADLIPKLLIWIQDKIISPLTSYFGISETIDPGSLKNLFTQNLSKAGGAASWLMQTLVHSGRAVFESIIAIILIPFVTFYLLRDWHLIKNAFLKLIPPKKRSYIIKLLKECDQVLSAFFRGQLFLIIALSLFYSIALSLLGLQAGVGIGLLIGISSIVPYLGVIVGIIITSIATLVQFNSFISLIWVGVIFLIGHSIENFYLTPKLIGDRVGLHPIVVIFAILAGGALFGFFGIILALPVAAILVVILRNAREAYYNSTFYKSHS